MSDREAYWIEWCFAVEADRDRLAKELAEARGLLERWHEWAQAFGGGERRETLDAIDDDTTTFLGLTANESGRRDK